MIKIEGSGSESTPKCHGSATLPEAVPRRRDTRPAPGRESGRAGSTGGRRRSSSRSRPRNRVFIETSFDSKQPKLGQKLVSALSETKRLFRLFQFFTETESFGVSIELKQTEEQPKQCDREHILVFFRKFRVVSVCFGLFRNSSFRNL
jgi:hypothetical protein